MSLAEQVIKHYGGLEATAKHFKYGTVEGVRLWKSRGIPKKFLLRIHDETGIPVKKLLTG